MILVLDNYDSFTWNLVHAVGALAPDADIRVVRSDAISPAGTEALGPSHIIISPGPCTPAKAGASNDIIRRLAGRIPILGVCLGHQCIAAAFGMRVTPHPVPVHGKTSPVHHDGRGVFAGIPSPMTAARYHSLIVVEDTIPSVGWQVSAWSRGPEGERIVMGLRRAWDDPTAAPLEGVQFHPESFLTDHGPALIGNFLKTSAGQQVVKTPFRARA